MSRPLTILFACADTRDEADTQWFGATEGSSDGSVSTAANPSSPSRADGADGTSQGDGALFDIGNTTADTSAQPPSCTVIDDQDGFGDCEEQAPPDSFEPDVQWTWTPESDIYSIVTPLVASSKRARSGSAARSEHAAATSASSSC